MFNRNKNDKGKTSQQTRMKISQKLKAKAKGIRKAASTAVVKSAGATGYVAGRAGENETISNVAKKAGKVGGNLHSKLSTENKDRVFNAERKVGGLLNKGRKQLERGTTAKATGAFLGGAVKGSYDARKKKNK